MAETDVLSDELERFSLNSEKSGQMAADHLSPTKPSFNSTTGRIKTTPYIEITKQPVNKYRYRYPCEKRSTGTITGANSTPTHKTYPTIKISNYTGNVRIIVSCVTKDKPYRPHPHSVVGREGGGWGAYIVNTEITDEASKLYPFKNLGIQCVRKRDIVAALEERKQVNIDPFKTGFDHVAYSGTIDLNAVRLCFQAFILDGSNRCHRPLPPVVSHIIYNHKTSGELIIAMSSHSAGSAKGGTQVVLLCEKLTKEEIAVEFYLEENNQVVWTKAGDVTLVHKECTIVFRTPPFQNQYITEIVTVQFRLKRKTDNARSNPLPFDYLPDIDYPEELLTSQLKLERQIKMENDDTTPLLPLPKYQRLHSFNEEYNQSDLFTSRASTNPSGNSPSWMTNYVQQPSVYLTLPSMFPNIPAVPTLPSFPNISNRNNNMQPLSPETQSITKNRQTTPMNVQPKSPAMPPEQLNGHSWLENVHTMPSNGQTMLPIVHHMSTNIHTISEDMPLASSSHTPWEIKDISPQKREISPNLQEPLSAAAGHQCMKMETDDPCTECLTAMAQNCDAELKIISGDISKVIAGKVNELGTNGHRAPKN